MDNLHRDNAAEIVMRWGLTVWFGALRLLGIKK